MAYPALLQREVTHRLIPLKFALAADPLEDLQLPQNTLAVLSKLADATNPRTLAEQGTSLAIGPGELLQGVPEAQIVNSAFCHPGIDGGRFHDRRRGAWYAGFEIETSLAEVAFHRRRFLAEARVKEKVSFEFQDFLADFAGQFHRLDEQECECCLLPQPVPQCYGPGQAVANSLLHAGGYGLVYSSVRNPRGTCIVCFRPAMVFYPRRGERYSLSIQVGSG